MAISDSSAWHPYCVEPRSEVSMIWPTTPGGGSYERPGLTAPAEIATGLQGAELG